MKQAYVQCSTLKTATRYCFCKWTNIEVCLC